MNVLVACEFSGIVREAFIRQGHDAWSCDLLPSEIPGNHYQCSIVDVIDKNWDILIAFPPCTHLCSSGARWFKTKTAEQNLALEFVHFLASADEHSKIPMIALENPIGVLSTRWRKPDQIIQPWMFGHPETKATCLWLKNLPKLVPTDIVEGRIARVHHEPPSPQRWMNRSRTLSGIAEAMANQWG